MGLDAAIRNLNLAFKLELVRVEELMMFTVNYICLYKPFQESFENVLFFHQVDDMVKKGLVDMKDLTQSAQKFIQKRKQFKDGMKHVCDMVDFTQAMHWAYRGLFSFALACKMHGAIKQWAKPELEATVYEKRFRFLRDAYRYISFENY